MRTLGLFAAALVGILLLWPAYAAGTAHPDYTVDEAQIYLGDPSDFRSPAVVDVDAVFRRIPEYREIVERSMDESNPRYLFLMRAASDRFRSALEAVAEKQGLDLIGGIGAVRARPNGDRVPVITRQTIEAL